VAYEGWSHITSEATGMILALQELFMVGTPLHKRSVDGPVGQQRAAHKALHRLVIVGLRARSS